MLVLHCNHDRVDKILIRKGANSLPQARESSERRGKKKGHETLSGKKKDAQFDDLRSSDYLRWFNYCVTEQKANICDPPSQCGPVHTVNASFPPSAE
jgi:hypothetical protein